MGGSSRHVIPVYLDGPKQSLVFFEEDSSNFCDWNGLTSSIVVESDVIQNGTIRLGKANHYGTVVHIKLEADQDIIVRPYVDQQSGEVIKTLNANGETLTVLFNGTTWVQIADTETTATTATSGTSLALSSNLTVDGNVKLGDAATDTIGFYDATAIVQPASADQAAVDVSGLPADGAASVADATHLEAAVDSIKELATLVNELRSNLVSLGLIKGQA